MWISNTRMLYCNTYQLTERMGSVLCTWVKLLTDLQTVWAANCMRLAAGLRPFTLGQL